MSFGRGERGGTRPSSGQARWPLPIGLVAGLVLDAILGDPERGHPVAAFGAAAAALEARDYRPSKIRGSVHTVACVVAVAIPAALADRRLADRPLARLALTGAAAWSVIGARSLRRVAARAADALARDDLPAARAILPSLCGRDPATLDAKDMARAIVESVAENTSDAVVAPLFWGAVAGLPGLVAYRAVNTLDAMVGHRSERYERFGWASARLDDMANWIPARLTALLTVACAPEPAAAWRALRDYGGHHPSPNAGRCEAAFAGALGLRLGGTNVYHGVADPRPHLGDGRAPEPADTGRANALSRAVTVAAAGVAVAVSLRPRTRWRVYERDP